MADDDRIESVDDLRYAMPQNVLSYETKFWGGLTLFDMIAIAIPFIAISAVTRGSMKIGGLILAALGSLVGFLVVRKWEGLGHRSLISYLVARVVHSIQQPVVEMPLIIPRSVGQERVTLRTWSGDTLLTIGGGDMSEPGVPGQQVGAAVGATHTPTAGDGAGCGEKPPPGKGWVLVGGDGGHRPD